MQLGALDGLRRDGSGRGHHEQLGHREQLGALDGLRRDGSGRGHREQLGALDGLESLRRDLESAPHGREWRRPRRTTLLSR